MTKFTSPPSPKVSLQSLVKPSLDDAWDKEPGLDGTENSLSVSSQADSNDDCESSVAEDSDDEDSDDESYELDDDDDDDDSSGYSTSSSDDSDFSDEEAQAIFMGLGLAKFLNTSNSNLAKKMDAPTTKSNMSDMAICKNLMERVEKGIAVAVPPSRSGGQQQAVVVPAVRPLFPAMSRSGFSRTQSIANFQAMGYVAPQGKNQVGLTPAERRAGFSKTASIANFQAMNHKSSGLSLESVDAAKKAILDLQKDVEKGAKPEENMAPQDYLAKLLGVECPKFSFDSLEGFFLPSRPEHVEAWNSELVGAIRNQDLAAALKKMHKEGKRLQACNQFGESIIHLCIRRGSPEQLKFLIFKVLISTRVCCDYGKTPLHDACWCMSSEKEGDAAFQKTEIMLRECPMMLHIADKRGFTPLSYVPKCKWAACRSLLDKMYEEGKLKPMLTPKL